MSSSTTPNTTKLSDVLTRDELRFFQKKSNIRALQTLISNWFLIVVAFALPIYWTNPVTILLGIIILGGRQLGLGILTHDCAHYAFFEDKRIDDFVGHWLCGAPVNVDLFDYRTSHLKHHKLAGTKDDPDLVYVNNYPVSEASIKRKFIRDFTGQTGLRDQLYLLKLFRLSKNYPWLVFNVVLLLVLTSVGAPWAYLMWWAATLFIFPAVVRLRQIGEHGVSVDRGSRNVRVNTGTTIAPWWQRIFIAPNNVNYHVEHHCLASVPPYNLPKLHLLLSERGFYQGFECITAGYGEVIRRATRTEQVSAA